MSSDIRLILGETTAILPTLEANSAALCLADPPFNVSGGKKNIDRSKWTTKAARSRVLVRDFGEWDREWPTNGAFWGFMRGWMAQVKRVLRPGGWLVVFCTQEATGQLTRVGEKAGLKKCQCFTWAKLNPAPGFVNAKMYSYGVEAAVIFRKPGSGVVWHAPIGTCNWLATPACGGSERLAHPCQKPLAILEPFIRHMTNPGDLVLDPFGGVASVATACALTGRRAISIERDAEYHQMGLDRLAPLLAQGSLFVPADLALAPEQTSLFEAPVAGAAQ